MRQRIDDALFPGGAARAGRLGLPLRAPSRSRRREPVLERRLPHDVDPVHLEGAHLVVLPPFQAVHHAAGVARVHHPALHRVLAGAETLDVLGEPHGGELAVGAVPAEADDGRHYELVEVRARRRPPLLPRRQPLAHDPCLTALRRLVLGDLHDVLLELWRRLPLNLQKPLRRKRQHQDPDPLPAEVQRDGPAELGRGAGEEHLPHAAGDLVEDHGSRQGVAVHHPHPQVRVLVHEKCAAAVESLVLVQRSKADDLDAHLVCPEDGELDLAVDALLRRRDEVLEAISRDAPRLVEPAAEEVEADGEGLGEEPLEEHEGEGDGPEREQHRAHGPRQRAAGAEGERHVHRRHHVHHVRQEHEVRHPVVHALVDLSLQPPRSGAEGPSEGVVQRHEQAEVAVLLPVVQAQIRGGVDEVSERREGGEGPVRDDLHVAVPHAPEAVEEEDVAVDQAHGPGARQEGSRQRGPHRQRQEQRLQRRAEPGRERLGTPRCPSPPPRPGFAGSPCYPSPTRRRSGGSRRRP
uniref:Uncharacterized protein n=1 Tax=Zea mays TaxID=4577 RepID=C0PIN3_MAIZE|nr:unknown [Zea mays]